VFLDEMKKRTMKGCMAKNSFVKSSDGLRKLEEQSERKKTLNKSLKLLQAGSLYREGDSRRLTWQLRKPQPRQQGNLTLE
jgi:hypothetical protein